MIYTAFLIYAAGMKFLVLSAILYGPGTILSLALQYALDAVDDSQLARPDRVVLISPMIGITRFARFAGIAGWPAILPAFAKAAWLSVLPEFNPFKYNSFPINGARQTHRLTVVLQEEIARLELEPAERYGINLGNLVARGELRALLVNANASLRLLSNPFFPYLLERIDPAAREGSLPAAATARR